MTPIQLVIHPSHRRLAELSVLAEQLGGYDKLSESAQRDLHESMVANANLVRKLDDLRTLSLIAANAGDDEWQHEICAEYDKATAGLRW